MMTGCESRDAIWEPVPRPRAWRRPRRARAVLGRTVRLDAPRVQANKAFRPTAAGSEPPSVGRAPWPAADS